MQGLVRSGCCRRARNRLARVTGHVGGAAKRKRRRKKGEAEAGAAMENRYCRAEEQ